MLRCRYELYGVITHTGISVSSGHYVAYVKVSNTKLRPKTPTNQTPAVAMDTDGLADPNNNADTNNNLSGSDLMPNQNEAPPSDDAATTWLECDDDAVNVLTDTQFQEVLASSGSTTPYMLFYHSLSQSHS